MAADEPRREMTVVMQKWLGRKPFVVVELDAVPGENFDDDPDDVLIKMTMEFGGGISRSGALGVMGTMLTENGWTTVAPEGFDPDADD